MARILLRMVTVQAITIVKLSQHNNQSQPQNKPQATGTYVD